MKRIADAAAAELARRATDDVPITAEEMIQLLARIARTGPPAARLRAIELLGARMGGLPDASAVGRPAPLSEDERAERIEAILAPARMRRAAAQQ